MQVNFYCNCDSSTTRKVACFDLDGTLIKPRSGNVFPINNDDWQPLYPNVGAELAALVQKGYLIVIFTNQLRQTEHTVHNIAAKIRAIMEFFQINPESYCYFISYGNNGYRKPMTGMFDLFRKQLQLDKSLSFYCGDAAGRAKTRMLKKDHSYVDWAFAQNIGLRFKLPEDVFKQPCDNRVVGTIPFSTGLFGMGTSPFPHKAFDDFYNSTTGPKVIIMVGAPASGKSTLATQLAQKFGFEIFSKDVNKTKFGKLVKDAAKANINMIIDNTSPTREVRQEYMFPGYAKLIVFHDIPRDLCMHMNAYRTQMDPEKPLISSVVYNVYFGKLERPDENESDHLTVLRLCPEHMTTPGNKEFTFYY